MKKLFAIGMILLVLAAGGGLYGAYRVSNGRPRARPHGTPCGGTAHGGPRQHPRAGG